MQPAGGADSPAGGRIHLNDFFQQRDVSVFTVFLIGVQAKREQSQNLFLLDSQFAVAGVVLLFFNKRLAFLKFIVVTELRNFVAVPLIVKIVKSTPAGFVVRILLFHQIPNRLETLVRAKKFDGRKRNERIEELCCGI